MQARLRLHQAHVVGRARLVVGIACADQPAVLRWRHCGLPRAQAAPCDLVDWCAARLAHYKVPSAVHVLPQMPTTGSGKILKTELRKTFGGAVPSAPGAVAPHTAVPAVVSLAEAAAVVAAACGDGVTCQPLDAGLGVEWGRELFPSLSYLLVVDRAGSICAQASPGLIRGAGMPRPAGLRSADFLLVPHSPCSAPLCSPQVEAAVAKGLRHLAVVALEKPEPEHFAGLTALATSGTKLLVLHVEQAACAAAVALRSQGGQLRTALAAARELLPPVTGVLHAPVAAADADAATTSVEAARDAAAQPQALPAATAPLAASPPKPSGGVETMRSTIVAALSALMGSAAAVAVGGDEPLMSAGLTSTMAVQLTQQLEASLGAELPGTLVFDYPSVNELAAFLAAELAGGSDSASGTAPVSATAAAVPTRPRAPPVASAPRRPAAAVAAPASRGAQESAATALVLQQVARLLGDASAANLAPDAPLMSAGLTSTLAVQLTQLLEEAVGAELPGTLVFDYPSAVEIGAFLVAEGVLPTGGSAAVSIPGAAAAAVQPASAAALQQRATLAQLVLQEVAALVGGAPADVAPDAPLMSAGLTSSLAVQLVSALEAAVGAELPGTLVFDYPTGARAR